MRILKVVIALVCVVNFWFSANARSEDSTLSTTLLNSAQHALTRAIVSDIFSPPVSSRIYLYSNIAAYQAALPADPQCTSLYGQLPAFPLVKFDGDTTAIDFHLASLYAFFQTGKKLVFSEAMLDDSLQHLLTLYKHLSSKKIQNSIAWARQVSDSILAWAARDQYKETRAFARYRLKKEDGKWIPTPPGYINAVEPFWYRMRPVTLDSSAQFQPPLALAFNKSKDSPFYQQAYEVYTTVNTLTPQQKDAANFWDCNPFYLNIGGHLNYATKKISPGGHWISITGIVAQQTHASFIKTLATYTMVSMALYDGFISCWDEKYRSNVIRPETFINSYIDESWHPLLQTPPFPEYTSGHSVISTAAAVVLTKMLGDNIQFTDISEREYGLPQRSFNSFEDAANEAAISRLYGGIHYRAAIENGQVQGRNVGNWVLKKIHLL